MRFCEQFNKLCEALVEMPFAAARATFAAGREAGAEHELQQTAWKAYDAWVQILNEYANGVLASPELGASAGQSLEASLRWQRFGVAMRDAFFAALWPAVGLPSAAELTELRAELHALRDDLSVARLEAEEARAAEAILQERQKSEALAGMWNGRWISAAAPFVQDRGEDEPAN